MSSGKKDKRRDSVTASGPYNRIRVIVFLLALLVALVVIAARAISGTV